MQKILSLSLLLPILFMASCSKESPYGIYQESEEDEYTATICISSGKIGTKAYIPNECPIDDGISRLDLYFFHKNDKSLDEHVVLTPDPGGVTTFKLTEKKDEKVSIVVCGNLDEDTAEYFTGKTTEELADSKSSNGVIFSAGNFSPERIPMVGCELVSFSKDQTLYEIRLYRLMCRIDVGTLNVDFDDPGLKGKEVLVKDIIVGNAVNYFPILSASNLGYFYSPYVFFGNDMNLTNAFGGVEYGFLWRHSFSGSMATSILSPEGEGKMSLSYPRLLNNNYMTERGTLIADATGEMGDATIHRYDNSSGEGLIVADGDVTSAHTFEVNRSFYTFFGSLGWPGDELSYDYDKQKCTQKLIIELVIDGKSWFYPIELKETQPNTIYKIDKITIRNLGSEYSNFFEKKYSADFTISVYDWSEYEVNNYNVGADPNTGEVVEPYN